MSKFCGVISRETGKNQLKESTIDYKYLNHLTKLLNYELGDCSEDFRTKFNYIKDQQQMLLTNEKNIVDLHKKMETLRSAMEKLETNIEEYTGNMLQLKKYIETLDCFKNCECCLSKAPSQQSTLLRMMTELDSSMINLDAQIAEIIECRQHSTAQVSPYDIIAKIIDCHNKTLTQLEQKMYIASDHSSIAEEALAEILNKWRAHVLGGPANKRPVQNSCNRDHA